MVLGAFGIPNTSNSSIVKKKKETNDEDLIHDVCIRANNTFLCEQILREFGLPNPDFGSLGKLSLVFASSLANATRLLIDHVFLHEATDNAIIRRQLLVCAKCYDLVIEDMSECYEALSRHEYVDLFNYAVIAKGNQLVCHQNFASEPPDLVRYGKFFQDYADMIRAIAQTAAGIKS
ncbi:hypothetical protein ACH5RR_030967 [Cinchona calisaya]|uniref:Pectinesterase inhibitor domain-containing protein n=1 Tax=Cinchona calisaya TaxID=153742 RepID=A0ABD2YI58_9GENT